MAERLLTRKELAEKLRVSYGTIFKLTKTESFPRATIISVSPKGKHFWLESKIDEWLKGQA